jgi:hypothetical protein
VGLELGRRWGEADDDRKVKTSRAVLGCWLKEALGVIAIPPSAD